MHKVLLLSALVIIGSGIVACTPASEIVMPPVNYDKPIAVHSHEKLYLQWQSGDTFASESQQPTPMITASGGGLGGVIAGAITAVVVTDVMHKANPGMY